MKQICRRIAQGLTVLFCLLMPCAVFAQSTTGSIYGNVADVSGAAIPGTTVTLKDQQTGVTQTTTTNSAGEYTFATVSPGEYVVDASATGFKTVTQAGVNVASNQNVHVVFAMQAGATSETVEVTAGTTLVDTRESQIGETIEQARVQDLPTLNRNPYDLVLTIPGVTSYTADQQTGSRDGTKIIANGLPAEFVSNYLDGAYSNSYKQGGVNKVPNPDAIQEFRILTSNFDAEFGRGPGAAINVITRSGTNQYHGTAYDYVRNDRLRSQPYFTQPGTKIQPYKQNQFGGAFGGRVPFLKDTFFFTSYEQLVLHQTTSITGVLGPTALERTGDFSQSAVKPNLASIDVGTGTGVCPGAATTYKVCAAALDPVAQNILKFVPVPAAGSQTLPQQNAPNNTSNYQGTGRLDYNGFHNHALELMFFNSQGTQIAPGAGGNQALGYSGMTQSEDQINGVFADTWSVNDRLVNTLRLFYTDNKYVIANLYTNHFLRDLGSNAGEGGPIYAPPKINISGYVSVGPAGAGPSNISQMSYGIVNTAILTRGHHSIKLGGSYVWNPYREDGGASSNGTFGFTGSQTQFVMGNKTTNGNALADFVLGRANSVVQGSSVSHRTHNYDPALFAQDDWQVLPRLNLNLGLRWEMFPPQCCEPNLVGTFYAGQQSIVVPKAPIGILYQGDPGVPNGLINTSLLNFSPRVGFAYDVHGDGNTSVRGGFGIFYATIQQYNNGTANQIPFSLSTTINGTPNLVCPYGGCTASNPAGADPYPFVYDPANPRFPDNATTQSFTRGAGTPYVYEYNLALEQQFGPKYAMHLGYVGNATRRNLIMLDVNAPIYFPGGQNISGGPIVAADVSTSGLNCRRPYEPYRTSGITRDPSCVYGGFRFGAINERVPAANGNYNSLQATLRGKIAHNLDLFATYVWSKNMTYDGPTVDNHDLHKSYGVADSDIRNRFTLSAIAHLPTPHFGGPAAAYVLGGWQLNVVQVLQSGQPFTVTSGSDTNRDGYTNDRVNITGTPYADVHGRQAKIYGFFNNSAFSIPSFTLSTDTNPYGNEQRNQLVGPRFTNTNVSLFKDFPIYERFKFQLRAEAFNALGNVNLAIPRTVFGNFSTLKAGTQIITGTQNDPRIYQFAGKLFF